MVAAKSSRPLRGAKDKPAPEPVPRHPAAPKTTPRPPIGVPEPRGRQASSNSTHKYELMVILDPEIDDRTVAPSLDKFLNVIRNDGGTIDNVDIWGRRRLAYEIQKKTEGIYAVVNFTATSDATVELDRQLKLSEAVLRTKVLRSEEAAARAISVRADDEKRAARKAAAAARTSDKTATAE